MKSLVTYINEAYKKVGEYRDKHHNGKYDIDFLQIIDRNFKEGVSDRDFESWIKTDINKCFKLKFDNKQINEIYLNLNPVSGFAGHSIVRGSAVTTNQWSWNPDTLKSLVKWLNTFGYNDNEGKEVRLRDGIIGWVITYRAIPGTEEPKDGQARLLLKLNKETEKLVDEYNRQIGQSISDYYGSKNPDGYTGD